MRRAARDRLETLAKPPGSLGRLEDLATRLAETQGRLLPFSTPRRLLIFAGDHGVVEENVGPWSSRVTEAMMCLMLSGRSASAALANATGTGLTIVDVGTCGASLAPHSDYRDWRVGKGTGNLARVPAMSARQFHAALAVGARATRESVDAGDRVLAVGEIGIGNSTAASCLAALLMGATITDMVGPGAGGTAAHLARKQAVVTTALRRQRGLLETHREDAIAAVAGFEIVAIAGCVMEAARLQTTVVLDGFIAGAGALIALALNPDALRTTIAAHLGSEPGHRQMMDYLGLETFLDWKLRLGEGTGALLLLPLLDAAAALLRDVGNLAEVTCRQSSIDLGPSPFVRPRSF